MDRITTAVDVPVSAGQAFSNFVHHLSEWWPGAYTWSQQTLKRIAIEPSAGGLCTEWGPFNFRCDWGRVLSVEDQKQIVFTWQISPTRVPEPDPDKASIIAVSFVEIAGSATRVELAHSHFENHGEGAADYRKAMASAGGWPYILNCFLQYCSK